MAKIPAEIKKRINGYVTKYMGILQIAEERPSLKLHNNPRSDWYGSMRHSGGPHRDRATLDLQKRILKNDNILERTVAHELIHHRDLVEEPGIIPKHGHGASFRKGAARINAIMGPGFVAEKIEALPEDRIKLMPVLGFGGLFFLWITLLHRERGPSPSTPTMPTMPTMPRRPSLPVNQRTNERGHYGKR